MQYSIEDVRIVDKEIYRDFFKRPQVWLRSAIYVCSGLVENLPSEDDWDYHELKSIFSSKIPEVERLDFINNTVFSSDYSRTFPFGEDTGINYTEHGRKIYIGMVEPLKFVEWLLGRTNNLSEELKRIYFEEKDKTAITKYLIGYTSPYIELMQQAIVTHSLSKSNQGKVEYLKEWFLNKASADLPISENMAKMMATMIRLPESQKGGLKKVTKNYSDPF